MPNDFLLRPRPSHRAYAASVLILLACLLPPAAATQEPTYDLLIRNGRVVDGTGSPWYRADIAINEDRIVRIAPRIDGTATRVIDAGDNIVAPGFIDIHTHARRAIFEVPTADNYIRQGVTTVLEGPDGSSPIPLGDFLDQLAETPLSLNIGAFIGQGSVRAEVMGETDRAPTAADMERMRRLVEQGMRDGAFGLSTGLFYVPGTFSTTDEVVELARVAAGFGGIHISHMREETAGVVESVRETIAIGERGGLPTQITHHKVIGAANWGLSRETLQLVDEARARGIDVTIDLYPYTASSTNIMAALFPAWAQEGGRDQVLERLGDAATRARVKAEVVRIIREERGGGDPANVVFARCEWDPLLDGRHLGEATRLRGLDATLENAAETVLWIVEQGNCSGIFHAISEEDLERILRHPATMIASDGEVAIFGSAAPHPRGYGSFPRVLGRYVRERQAITLEEAIRKMTSYPAQRMSIMDRGVLRPGMKADLVIFDPAGVRDMATFEQPHQYAEGIPYVIVNGQLVVDGSSITAARPGRVLRGGAWEGR